MRELTSEEEVGIRTILLTKGVPPSLLTPLTMKHALHFWKQTQGYKPYIEDWRTILDTYVEKGGPMSKLPKKVVIDGVEYTVKCAVEGLSSGREYVLNSKTHAAVRLCHAPSDGHYPASAKTSGEVVHYEW